MNKNKIISLLLSGAMLATISGTTGAIVNNRKAANTSTKNITLLANHNAQDSTGYACVVNGNNKLVLTNKQGQIISYLSVGEMLHIGQVSGSNTFVTVKSTGANGYIANANMLNINNSTTNNITRMNRNGYVINVSSSVNLRQGPGMNTNVIAGLSNNTAIRITGKTGQWYRVSVNGTKGYIFEEYVAESTTNATTNVNPTTTIATPVKTTKTSAVINHGELQPNVPSKPVTNHGELQPNVQGKPVTNHGELQPNVQGKPVTNHGELQPNVQGKPVTNHGELQPNVQGKPVTNHGELQPNIPSKPVTNHGELQPNVPSKPVTNHGELQPNVQGKPVTNHGELQPNVQGKPMTNHGELQPNVQGKPVTNHGELQPNVQGKPVTNHGELQPNVQGKPVTNHGELQPNVQGKPVTNHGELQPNTKPTNPTKPAVKPTEPDSTNHGQLQPNTKPTNPTKPVVKPTEPDSTNHGQLQPNTKPTNPTKPVVKPTEPDSTNHGQLQPNTKPAKPSTSQPGQTSNGQNSYIQGTVNSNAPSSIPVRSGNGTWAAPIQNVTVSPNQQVNIIANMNGWYKINDNGVIGFIPAIYVTAQGNVPNISNVYNNSNSTNVADPYNYTLPEYVSAELNSYMKVKGNSLTKAEIDEVKNQLTTAINPKAASTMFEFLDAAQYRNINETLLANVLSNQGVLSGQAQTFINAAKEYNIDPVALVSQIMLESAHGTSQFATGMKFKGEIVYNVSGANAVDAAPKLGAATYAYNHGWTSVSKAIYGAAQLLSTKYYHNTNIPSLTPYSLRFFNGPTNDLWHQYGTA
ncbi:MAG: SH3 domain-containing protein, partial [Sarcina sp.]